MLNDALGDTAGGGISLHKNERNDWTLEWFFKQKPGEDDLTARINILTQMNNLEDLGITAKNWEISEVPEKNWLEESYKQLQRFSIGPFFIYGAHYEDDNPEGQIGLQIESATAFGSGGHGTTKTCLLAMSGLKEEGLCPWNVLDMGTGSGILAIAAWKLWKTPILAVDIDEEAVKVANRHRKANDVKEGSASLTCIQGDGFQAPIVQERKPYDLITANILAGPLQDMATDLTAVLDEKGHVILSGMLTGKADNVLKTYEALGLKLKQRYDLDEWSTLVLQQ